MFSYSVAKNANGRRIAGVAMIVSVQPPEFLPYLGFWNRLYHADLMVVADTMRFRHRHYQNRNRVRTADGWSWFTVPVSRRGSMLRDIEVKSRSGVRRGWSIVEANYRGRARYWEDYADLVFEFLGHKKLIDVNVGLIRRMTELLGIATPVKMCSDITDAVVEDFHALSMHIAEETGADALLSGAGNIGTLPKRFPDADIEFVFQDYVNIPYPQVHPGWHPRMSILDCLLTHGAQYTLKHVKGGWRPQEETDNAEVCSEQSTGS